MEQVCYYVVIKFKGLEYNRSSEMVPGFGDCEKAGMRAGADVGKYLDYEFCG